LHFGQVHVFAIPVACSDALDDPNVALDCSLKVPELLLTCRAFVHGDGRTDSLELDERAWPAS
jgi:hypothetical protein